MQLPNRYCLDIEEIATDPEACLEDLLNALESASENVGYYTDDSQESRRSAIAARNIKKRILEKYEPADERSESY